MPASNDDGFVEAVRPALEALLVDLQNTTEVLKRGQMSARQFQEQEDKEPIYQPQKVKVRPASATGTHGLDKLEQLLDDYSHKRAAGHMSKQNAEGDRDGSRPTVASLFTELDGSIVDNAKRPLSNGLDGRADSAEEYSRLKKVSPEEEDPNQLDSMLGTLQSDMSKHGISTIPKGDCAACGKTIIGQVVIALGKMWHPEHYVCCHCSEELGHRNFFERAGKAYCEEDYHNLFSPRCDYCNGPIKDRCVTALDKTWHPEHFVCMECGREFGEDGFHEKDGKAFCRSDYFRMFAPKCRGCKRPINNNFITALSTHWHPECFVCQDCGQGFQGGSFFDHEGLPLCETHYHWRRGSLCSSCQAPISGRCVSAMGQKFHPEHFVCSFCRRQLNKGTFKENDGKPFCHKCFAKLLNP